MKPTAEPVDASSDRELELTKAELSHLRQNYAVLDTNFKRGQKKIQRLEVEIDALKNPKDASPLVHVKDTPASSGAADITPTTSTAETSLEQTREHISDWSPPYCADCGTTNISFKDEVECSDCKAPLGSEKYAKHNMKICPMCGKNAGFRPRKGYTPKHDRCTGPECSVKA